MEFLFLNEEVSQVENPLDQMKAFAESVGVDVSDVANKNLDEVMLEATENFAEAEMTAMQEEFALFQESVGQEDQEVFQESVVKKVGETLKKWWKAIKDWCVKMWSKIVHWFWVAVQWMRKTVQSAIQKVAGSKTVYLPKSLAEAAGASVGKVSEAQSIITEAEKEIMSAATKEGVIKLKTLEKKVADWKKNQEKLNFKTPDKEAGKGQVEAVPVETWKKWMDQALKDYETVKKAVEKANKSAQNAIKNNDKKLEEFYSKNTGNKEEILNTGKKLRASAMVIAKVGAAETSTYRRLMGKLFSSASFRNKKEKEEFNA